MRELVSRPRGPIPGLEHDLDRLARDRQACVVHDGDSEHRVRSRAGVQTESLGNLSEGGEPEAHVGGAIRGHVHALRIDVDALQLEPGWSARVVP